MVIIDLTRHRDESRGREKYRLSDESVIRMDRSLLQSECHNPMFFAFNHAFHFLHHHPSSTFLNNYHDTILYEFANQVPVFFITADMGGKRMEVTFFGRSLEFTIPYDRGIKREISIDDILNERIERLQYPEVENEDEDLLSDEERRREVVKKKIIDLWGVYVAKAPFRGPCTFKDVQPMIFIWVDKIFNYSHGCRNMYEFLTCNVIFHELMHAFMDVEHYMHGNNIPDDFRILKEESLAEAGALMLMKRNWPESDIMFLLWCIKSKPYEYRLGAFYYEAGEDAVRHALEAWIEMKMGHRELNVKLYHHWLKYLMTNLPQPLNSKQIELFERGFDWPEGVFMYKGHLYDNHDMPVCVIRDYVLDHREITKAELMKEFPSTLNKYYDVFIDPVVQSEFIGKVDGNVRSAEEANRVSCADGSLVICDYWHPNSIPLFLDHIRKLGFEVENFD